MREDVMNVREDDGGAVTYSRSNDNVARLIAYLGPYLFWGTLCVLTSGVMLFA